MRAHPVWLDVLITAGVALLALAELVSDGSAYPVGLVRGLPLAVLPRVSGLLIVQMLLTAPLLIRRRHPTWCFALVSPPKRCCCPASVRCSASDSACCRAGPARSRCSVRDKPR